MGEHKHNPTATAAKNGELPPKKKPMGTAESREWKCVGQAGGLRWTGKRRPEVDLYPAQMEIRWEKEE